MGDLIETLQDEVQRLRAYLRSCRISLKDGYSREAVIHEINVCLGEAPPKEETHE